jgi:hypothetical protein
MVRAICAALCLVAWMAGAAGAFDPGPYCAGVYQCLGEKAPACTRELCEPIPGIDYSADFCALFVELRRRGLTPDTFWGRQIYARLGHKHRVTYEVRGSIPLPPGAVRFLLDDVPFAAGLINAYEGTRYAAHYTGRAHKQFWGCNGKGMQGTFATALQDSEQARTVYFGHGRAQVLMWNMSGAALVLLECEPAGDGQTSYRFRSVVFPESRWVQTVLDFFLFRRAVIKNVYDIISSVEQAAHAFSDGPAAPLRQSGLRAGATGDERLKAFLKTLNSDNHSGL